MLSVNPLPDPKDSWLGGIYDVILGKITRLLTLTLLVGP